ncbi:alpha/beta family hydrolase [Marinobacter sp.]|uniref:alpha/beta family hydrolase n=1 Tax=Marinobacter sp. TaxID=50741 RepID=UPI0025C02DF8|nr:alpha/beta family hydrolase [Marinobacter sp.]
MNRITTNSYDNAAKSVMLLAHGAGAPMDSPFMDQLAAALDQQGIASVRFEFPYMVRRREDGKKRPPDRMPILLDCFREQIDRVRRETSPGCRLVVAGKSMGGRVASMLASEDAGDLAAVICFGYPFHPPGKPDQWRIDHLPAVHCPLMVVQGTRDAFGKIDEVRARSGVEGISRWCWLDGGNHDFQPLAKQPEQQSDLINRAAVESRQFLDDVLQDSSGSCS